MDLFLNWFDLKPGVSDVGFCEALEDGSALLLHAIGQATGGQNPPDTP